MPLADGLKVKDENSEDSGVTPGGMASVGAFHPIKCILAT